MTADDTGPATEAPVERVESILRDFEREAADVRDLDALEELDARFLGRKRGRLTDVFQSLRDLEPGERKSVGGAANLARQAIEERISELRDRLRNAARKATARAEAIDVSLPGIGDPLGGLHPVTRTQMEIENIFVAMGYEVVEGPEIETDWYNFGALNFPPDHPARDEQDTLLLRDDLLLRTHTSPMQVRYMETHEAPFAVLVPGKVFRRDTPDATHTPVFTQCEGLVVDTDITMADLKGTLDAFAKALFGPETRTRFRPGYFPFTEPSAEVDAWLGDRWVEILGCGMVHPAVFAAAGHDPDRAQGFAFGMGIERITTVRYGIEDIRQYYDNDLRFLRQFVG